MQPLDPAPAVALSSGGDYQGGSALMVRIHHCIADGIALISVTMSLVDGGAAAARAPRKAAPQAPRTGLPTP
jgi:diacylglycerol O-acyltransferase